MISSKTNAQFVYVPDANLRAAISALIPTAIVGDSLDTSDPTVNSLTVLDVSSWNISDLNGVQYFPNVGLFLCNNNPLSVLNYLPPTAFHVECASCNLTSVSSLPSSLQILYCNNNALTGLPQLPLGLSVLQANNNSLTSLPTLPAQLSSLILSNNQLSALGFLPNGLYTLLCDFNLLTALPVLPNTLNGLNCSHNSITSIPFLPANIVDLNISNNQISCLPMLPDSMHHLIATGNSITCLPNLPSSPLFTSDVGTTICSLPGSSTVANVTCSGVCNGSITMGFGVPYTFLWSNASTAPSVFNLCAGPINVIITDPNACAYTQSWMITQPSPITLNIVTANATCGNADGSITVFVSGGGSAPFLFSIDGGITWQGSNIFTNIFSGTYNVSVVDANSCSANANAIVSATGGPVIAGVTTIPISCYNSTDGSILVNVSGGTTPYEYSLDTGVTFQPLNLFSNLAAGTWLVAVKDSAGCFTTANTTVTEPTPLMLSFATTQVSCGNFDGTATAIVTGGIPPYTYLWSNGAINPTQINLSVGVYWVTVWDANACSVTDTVYITSGSTLTLSILSTTNVFCNGGNNGDITAMASGGTAPYLYSIDFGITWQTSGTFSNLVAGTYTILGQDANGCQAFAVASIAQPSPISITYPSSVYSCSGNPVLLCPLFSGGTPPYAYLWSTSGFSNCELATFPGVYSIIVTDMNGCTASFSIIVNFSPDPNFASVTNIILPTCGMCDGSAEIITPFTQAATYLWLPGNITASINSQLCDQGNNSVIITDTSGCVDTLDFSLSCHSVWPGDANNDGQADNTDLLAIGIGYGATGEPRENATIQWQSEKGVDWADSLASGTNYKHIDCNGDGLIADDDTIAIIQNFGLTHPLHPAIIPMVLTDPPLYFDIQIDSANVDTALQFPLMLGTAAIPADSIYGIAFTVSYDTALVKADSVTMDFMNCWMNSATGHVLGIAVNDPLNGKLYGAVTRTSHTDTSGYGPIGNFGVVTVDNISARMTSLYADTLVLGISDVTLISHDEQYKTVNIIIDSLIINDNTVGVYENEKPLPLNIYPNPANRFMFVEYDQQIQKPEFTLHNILNQEQNINYRNGNGKTIIDLSNVANGIYLLYMKSEKGIVTRKINIQR